LDIAKERASENKIENGPEAVSQNYNEIIMLLEDKMKRY